MASSNRLRVVSGEQPTYCNEPDVGCASSTIINGFLTDIFQNRDLSTVENSRMSLTMAEGQKDPINDECGVPLFQKFFSTVV